MLTWDIFHRDIPMDRKQWFFEGYENSTLISKKATLFNNSLLYHSWFVWRFQFWYLLSSFRRANIDSGVPRGDLGDLEMVWGHLVTRLFSPKKKCEKKRKLNNGLGGCQFQLWVRPKTCVFLRRAWNMRTGIVSIGLTPSAVICKLNFLLGHYFPWCTRIMSGGRWTKRDRR